MNTNKIGKVGVLYGGTSAEREVSLNSGRAVYDALIRKGFDAKLYDVADDFLSVVSKKPFDVAFIVLHGRGGEDGTIQGILDWQNIPYTGSGLQSSAIAMDKVLTKELWKANGLPVLPEVILNDGFDAESVVSKIGFPMAIKPSLEGSSVGIYKVSSTSELEMAYKESSKCNSTIMAEKWIEGDELTGTVLSGEVMPLIKITASEGFYDYHAKYNSKTTNYECPCGIDSDLEKKIQNMILKASEIIKIKSWARVDVMLDSDNNPWLLEINTVPGMTETSLVPKSAGFAGYSFDDLVVQILTDSMEGCYA